MPCAADGAVRLHSGEVIGLIDNLIHPPSMRLRGWTGYAQVAPEAVQRGCLQRKGLAPELPSP